MTLAVMSIRTVGLGNARDAVKRNREREPARKYGRLATNRRFEKGHNDRESILLTARRDLVGIRETILGGSRDQALEKTDWLIDNIDNMLAEGC